MTNPAGSIPGSLPAAVESPREMLRRWAIVGLLCLAFVIAYIDRQNLSFALTDHSFKDFFGLTDSSRGLLNSAFFWTYAVLQIPAGWVVDRFGVKFPYFIGFTLWCLASASTALTRSIPQ